MCLDDGTPFLVRHGLGHITVFFLLDLIRISPAEYLRDYTTHVAFAMHSRPYNFQATTVDAQPNLFHSR